MMENFGDKRVKTFYDEKGWQESYGSSTDGVLFGAREDGPIRIELGALHQYRIKAALTKAGNGIKFLECGCGGAPETAFLDLCSEYTGTDFSQTGLDLAKTKLDSATIPYNLILADVCSLPFDDSSFDAVYCAHLIYHITDRAAQETALAELLRVTKDGGIVVVISANPYPLMFPITAIKRIVAALPLIGTIIDQLREAPPLPYNPMPIGWFKRKLTHAGDLELLTYALPSIYFNQNITEFRGVGRMMWMLVRWCDFNYPKLSAYLGNYILISVQKFARL